MVSPGYSVRDARFTRTIAGISGTDYSGGNQMEIIDQGIETFHSLFEMVKSAKKTINIEMYLVDDDEIGMQFANLLSEKAREGVRVNFIIDSIGGWRTGKRFVQSLRESGVRLHFYNPLSFKNFYRLQDRTHKKIIVIDGHTGMVGGFGISDLWYDDGGNTEKIKDLQVKLRGPIVHQMQHIFSANWKKMTGELLSGDDYYPEIVSKGDIRAHMIHSVPFAGKGVIHQMFLFAIKSARDYLYIENAYFVPDSYLVKTLKEAARKGVDVRLLIPGPDTTDVTGAAFAGRNFYKDLLKSGVKIYEYKKQKLHSKFMVMDDSWVTLGSANFDIRSMQKSQEANLNVMDVSFSIKLKKIFCDDLADSTPVTMESYRDRSFGSRIMEVFYGMFESQM